MIDGDEEANQSLLMRCLNRFEGVPVWHLHERIERLKWMAGAFGRVAIGSSGQWSRPGTPDWWERMNEVMPAICFGDGRPKAKIHGLRMLNPAIVSKLPMSSADSSHATRNGGDRSRINPRIATWQRANLIADSIEAVQAAECWVPVKVRRETTRSTPLFME